MHKFIRSLYILTLQLESRLLINKDFPQLLRSKSAIVVTPIIYLTYLKLGVGEI